MEKLEENRRWAIVLDCHEDAKWYSVVAIDDGRVWETAIDSNAWWSHPSRNVRG